MNSKLLMIVQIPQLDGKTVAKALSAKSDNTFYYIY
jgi:hypothetical protein